MYFVGSRKHEAGGETQSLFALAICNRANGRNMGIVSRLTARGSTTPATWRPGMQLTSNAQHARKLMIDGLRNAHGLEQQATVMLERNAERLEHYPQLKARVMQHLEETRQQQAMVAHVLEELGESPSTIKDTVMGLAEYVQMMVHSASSDEVLKNSYTGYAFEHFEIASYTALIVIARAAGEPRV